MERSVAVDPKAANKKTEIDTFVSKLLPFPYFLRSPDGMYMAIYGSLLDHTTKFVIMCIAEEYLFKVHSLAHDECMLTLSSMSR